MVKNKDMQFFMENLKIKRKKDKKFLTFRTGDSWFEPQIFSNFPAYDLNFYVKWGVRDQIKTSF